MWLRYAPWRVACRRCGVRVEQVAWAVGQSAFTALFEELAAYLSQVTDRTTVGRLLGVSWPPVGSIVQRVVARRLDGGAVRGADADRHRRVQLSEAAPLPDGGRRPRTPSRGLGRRGAQCADAGRVLRPVGVGRLRTDCLGDGRLGGGLPEGAAGTRTARAGGLRPVSCRASRGRRSRRSSAGGATTRRPDGGQGSEGDALSAAEAPGRLRPGEAHRLATLRRPNRALDHAYELKEYLATILEQATPTDAPELLAEWLGWAARSRLTPFVKLGRTIRQHATAILAYLDTRLTNGPIEGINNKLRVVARRA